MAGWSRARSRSPSGRSPRAWPAPAASCSDAARHAASLTGQARDGANAAQGEIAWRLEAAPDGCLLHIELAWRLTGPLAQFSRPALLRSLVRSLAADFARNMESGRVARKLSAFALLGLWLRGLLSR